MSEVVPLQQQQLIGINLHGCPVFNDKGPVLETYDCNKCHLILRDPRQAECGCRFCLSCSQALLAASTECPNCKEILSEQMYPDIFIRKQLAKFKVQCNCLTMILLIDFEAHWEKCPKALTLCPYGCGATILIGDRISHAESCPQKPVVCRLCQKAIPVESSSGCPPLEHYQSCNAFNKSEPAVCPDCSAPLLDGNAAFCHISSSCFKSVQSCPLAIDASCAQKMDAESYKEHCLKNPSHLVALTVGYTALQKNVSDLQKKLASTQTQKGDGDGDEALKERDMKMHALQTKVAQLESDNAAKGNLVAALNTELQDCRGTVQTLVAQMQQVLRVLPFGGNSLIFGHPDYNETDAKMAVPPKSGSSDLGFFDVYALKSSSSNVSSVSSDRRAGYEMKSLDSMSVKQRPSDVDSVSSAAVGHLEHRMAGVEDKVAHMQMQVEHLSSQPQTLEVMKRDLHSVHNQMHILDNRLTQYSNMMEEMSLRQELQEVKTTAGVFVWKITDVQRRYREAMEGKTLSLYSPPFYTSPHGYRMCIRTYLYGDGTGKGSHISVFFVVMKSEHDQLLSWPFKQKVTISLMNQDTPAEQFSHITETFLPDPSSTSFRKPETEMNVASGFPKFVKKSVLKDSRFVKGDTMYLRVRVDRTGLVPE